MNYYEIAIEIPKDNPELSEIIVAFFSDLNFESFVEENSTLFAYIGEESFGLKEIDFITDVLYNYNLSYNSRIIPQQNWNENWEKNFSPIIIDDILSIKATFHQQEFDTKHSIIIDPKMSFGTGHHPTTYMMCKLISEYNYDNKSVLDYGCGTAVLAIYASMLGSKDITCIDIDEWAYKNSIDNIDKNIKDTSVSSNVILGDINSVPKIQYDFIFANINLNILKKDIPSLSNLLNIGSTLILSGFLENELPQIEDVCINNGLKQVKHIEKDNWIAVSYIKI